MHITQPRFKQLLQAVLNTVTVEEVRSAASFNRKHLFRTLIEIQRTNLNAENVQ